VLNIVAKSLSNPSQVASIKGYQIWPNGLSSIHYKVIFTNKVVWRAFANSVLITVVGVAINIVLTSSAAYALTRPKLVGKKVFMVFLIIMMIFEPGIIQEYFVMKDLKLLDSLLSMILFRSVNVYNLILLMRFFSETPESLLEAAKIDGAGHIKTFYTVVMPLCKPAWITLIILSFQSMWGATGGTFIYSEELKPLSYVLSQIVSSGISRTGVSSAVSLIMLSVPVTVFIISQSNVLETMATSGMKG